MKEHVSIRPGYLYFFNGSAYSNKLLFFCDSHVTERNRAPGIFAVIGGGPYQLHHEIDYVLHDKSVHLATIEHFRDFHAGKRDAISFRKNSPFSTRFRKNGDLPPNTFFYRLNFSSSHVLSFKGEENVVEISSVSQLEAILDSEFPSLHEKLRTIAKELFIGVFPANPFSFKSIPFIKPPL